MFWDGESWRNLLFVALGMVIFFLGIGHVTQTVIREDGEAQVRKVEAAGEAAIGVVKEWKR